MLPSAGFNAASPGFQAIASGAFGAVSPYSADLLSQVGVLPPTNIRIYNRVLQAKDDTGKRQVLRENLRLEQYINLTQLATLKQTMERIEKEVVDNMKVEPMEEPFEQAKQEEAATSEDPQGEPESTAAPEEPQRKRSMPIEGEGGPLEKAMRHTMAMNATATAVATAVGPVPEGEAAKSSSARPVAPQAPLSYRNVAPLRKNSATTHNSQPVFMRRPSTVVTPMMGHTLLPQFPNATMAPGMPMASAIPMASTMPTTSAAPMASGIASPSGNSGFDVVDVLLEYGQINSGGVPKVTALCHVPLNCVPQHVLARAYQKRQAGFGQAGGNIFAPWLNSNSPVVESPMFQKSQVAKASSPPQLTRVPSTDECIRVAEPEAAATPKSKGVPEAEPLETKPGNE
ncbi:hypothetical protein L596_018396 [Steinernema carpocapsae]|uniref:Uncharacterized protein n=1 Tax=Steinernema carpocapsae TaxID=34508 RepID=A0A4U5N4H9_STECR|nr:hypothetical protein L596_018396 [Steinernema carpocapsae]